jgi:hypothetical protein
MIKFLKQCTSLKNPLPKHYFISLLKDLSNEDLVTLCELLTRKIAEPKKRLSLVEKPIFQLVIWVTKIQGI